MSVPFPPTPVVRRLTFDADAMAVITRFEGTTTVNWSATASLDGFLHAVELALDVGHDPEVTIQRTGTPTLEEFRPGDLVPTKWLSAQDLAVEFYRIDVTDTRSVAWQRVSTTSIFVGLGDADSAITDDATALTQLMTDTARSEIDVILTISTLHEIVGDQPEHQARDQGEGPGMTRGAT